MRASGRDRFFRLEAMRTPGNKPSGSKISTIVLYGIMINPKERKTATPITLTAVKVLPNGLFKVLARSYGIPNSRESIISCFVAGFSRNLFIKPPPKSSPLPETKEIIE
eukprot:TRINITY_DN1646_c0_g1_i6.p2 TRINITY_DN1646_c0_g1~~TRINITY_DN1646_c0_g1_i6.p2  ORF type:complete len:109 (+),score=8.33 TRINITY_DN1646_c0_g1_i6:229-555(+)